MAAMRAAADAILLATAVLGAPAALGAAAVDVGTPLPAPPFERHAVVPAFRGKPAPVDLASDPKAPRFRTVLRRGAAEGPNFADRFTVVTWGCGTGCQEHAIVDARTGRVRMLPGQTGLGVAFRRDSRLFVAEPADSCRDTDTVAPETTRWSVWNGRRLVPIASFRSVAPCGAPR